MDDERRDEHAEGEGAKKLSEKLPGSVSGKGDTPLGDSDQHSDAPGPHGLDEEDEE